MTIRFVGHVTKLEECILDQVLITIHPESAICDREITFTASKEQSKTYPLGTQVQIQIHPCGTRVENETISK
jgi:hypothetical protein